MIHGGVKVRHGDPDPLHKRGGDCGPSAVAIALSWVFYGIKPIGTMELGGATEL